MFNAKEISVEFAPGKTLRYETGKIAKQAKGAVIVQQGDAVQLSTMCYGAETEADFFPLTVEYREKMYAAGRIPGGYFRREGKPTDDEVLTSRLIDRPIRPMFPDNFRREVQIINQVLSADRTIPGDVMGIGAASLAVGLSDLPFPEQVAGVRVAKLGEDYIVNPTYEEMETADLEMVVAGTENSVVMVEGGAWEVQEAELIAAIAVGHEAIKKLCRAQQQLIDELAVEKQEIVIKTHDEELYKAVSSLVREQLAATFKIPMTKSQHYPEMSRLEKAMQVELAEKFPAFAERSKEAKAIFKDIEKDEMREAILRDSIRIDGRKLDDVRPITIEVGVLPSTHGTALFQRGETQALAVATLGSKADEQRIETLQGEVTKTYMLHYNFPAYSVGEVKRFGAQSRREVGHGHLAERSLYPVLPHPEDFPYTLRVVSEIMESNGSSSMASVCSGALSLMDAGVPIKGAVAGIAMGLISDGERTAVLSDISGTEDHLGDMDFKVAGTKDGITAFQMDIKIKGLKPEIMAQALAQAKAGREHILSKMNEVLPASRPELSANAPVVLSTSIPSGKIRDVIGPGGSVIRGIQAATGAKIDINDNGAVQISAPGRKAGNLAMKMVKEIVAEAEPGKVYKGKVKSIVQFGAFVEILPGKDGLVHISELANRKVERVEDVLALGDEIDVLCLGVDPKGKIKLSIKALSQPAEAPAEEQVETSTEA
jgi:polyribonucleotide nucleotidyltransferase